MLLDSRNLDYKILNQKIRQADGEVTVTNCCGQRFVAAGMTDRQITIEGVPGNALAAYLDGASVTVKGNVQDAVGDTMNSGTIVVHGNIGDAAGYAMRGGKIYVRGNAGYRAGIHMKEYEDKVPVIIIGGSAGSFLGEYQAGGIIIVLGINPASPRLVGNFPCTGMHNGRVFLRGSTEGILFPENVCARPATPDDMALIEEELKEYCRLFGYDMAFVLSEPFTVVTADSKNPYRQMYVRN